MRNSKLPALLLLLLCMALSASPASAFDGAGEALPGKVNTSWAEEAEPVTGGIEPEQAETPDEASETANALTPEGNLTLVDHIQDDDGSGKQFLTVTTRNGHYFYLVIDRTKSGENNVHFLNQVDESDLLSILEEGDDASGPSAPLVCTCSERCYPGHVDTSCPVCTVNMSECVGKEAQPEQPETPDDPAAPDQPPEKNAFNPIPTIIAFSVMAVGGAVYFFKFRQKPSAKGSTDLEEYDYGEAEEPELYEREDGEE